jgi:hypothetical protein
MFAGKNLYTDLQLPFLFTSDLQDAGCSLWANCIKDVSARPLDHGIGRYP